MGSSQIRCTTKDHLRKLGSILRVIGGLRCRTQGWSPLCCRAHSTFGVEKGVPETQTGAR